MTETSEPPQAQLQIIVNNDAGTDTAEKKKSPKRKRFADRIKALDVLNEEAMEKNTDKMIKKLGQKKKRKPKDPRILKRHYTSKYDSMTKEDLITAIVQKGYPETKANTLNKTQLISAYRRYVKGNRTYKRNFANESAYIAVPREEMEIALSNRGYPVYKLAEKDDTAVKRMYLKYVINKKDFGQRSHPVTRSKNSHKRSDAGKKRGTPATKLSVEELKLALLNKEYPTSKMASLTKPELVRLYRRYVLGNRTYVGSKTKVPRKKATALKSAVAKKGGVHRKTTKTGTKKTGTKKTGTKTKKNQ